MLQRSGYRKLKTDYDGQKYGENGGQHKSKNVFIYYIINLTENHKTLLYAKYIDLFNVN